MKSLTKYFTIPLILGSLFFSSIKQASAEDISINNSSYSINENNIIQTKSSFLDDGLIKIGVVSDIEGAINNAIKSAKKLKKQNIDLVIIAGDSYENEKIRRNPVYPHSTNNLEEMVNGITPYAKLGVPILIIPGNHETKNIYSNAIKKLKKSYPNVFDIRNHSVDLEGVNIVGMGGYHNPRFTTPNGFLLKRENYMNAINGLSNFQKQNEPTIFVTHGPPKSRTKIDFVIRAGHVGDKNIEIIMNYKLKELINVHGHIHEGGRNSDIYPAGISINVASITDYNNSLGANTGMITIDDKGFRYSDLK